jgi:hypothetical protein
MDGLAKTLLTVTRRLWMRWTSDHRRSWLVGLVVLVSMLGLGACAPPTLPMQQPVVVDPSGRILRDDVIDLRRAFGVYPNEWSRWIDCVRQRRAGRSRACSLVLHVP